ncbi:winged helix-turn-helix transcriptional regulator [Candidatus Gottesmanbacteria bacterium]|nr:winged helix-turn-helix transcriptional regulator [Candidatus Gottesmanbacteria bacterium]
MLTKAQIKKIKVGTAKNDGQLPLIFEALGDGGRFRMFRLLTAHHDLCVTDIAEVFGITISAASQQLKILERVGLIQKIRMGQMVCYEIKEDPGLRRIVQLLQYEK